MNMLDEGEQQGKGTKSRKSRENNHRVISGLTDAYFETGLVTPFIVETSTINRRVVVERNNRASIQPTDHSFCTHTVLTGKEY